MEIGKGIARASATLRVFEGLLVAASVPTFTAPRGVAVPARHPLSLLSVVPTAALATMGCAGSTSAGEAYKWTVLRCKCCACGGRGKYWRCVFDYVA